MDQIAHFWPEWWFKLFTSAYRGSPPPAVFQNKYQSYKYERNTAGKSATIEPNPFGLTPTLINEMGVVQNFYQPNGGGPTF